MKKILLIPALALLALPACQKHENPLKALSARDVASWIYKNKTLEISTCATFWENQNTASKQNLQACESTAQELAELLSKSGFGDVRAKDVPLPTIWQAFNELEQISKRNSFDAQQAGEAMKLAPKGSLGNRIEEYKKQRNLNKK